jgi:hypothetical protein
MNRKTTKGVGSDIDSVSPTWDHSDELPAESLPLGTLVRATRFNRLGAITDSFYGDKDVDGENIIVYTVLLFPPGRGSSHSSTSPPEDYYISNEYEYDIIAYLMVGPVNLKKLVKNLGGGLLL